MPLFFPKRTPHLLSLIYFFFVHLSLEFGGATGRTEDLEHSFFFLYGPTTRYIYN